MLGFQAGEPDWIDSPVPADGVDGNILGFQGGMSTWVPPTPPGGLPAVPDNDDFVLGLVNGVPTWKAAPTATPTLIRERLKLAINQSDADDNIFGFYWGLPAPQEGPREVVILPAEANWLIIMLDILSGFPNNPDKTNYVTWVSAAKFRAVDAVSNIDADGRPFVGDGQTFLETKPYMNATEGNNIFDVSISLRRFNNLFTNGEDWVGGSLHYKVVKGSSSFASHLQERIGIWWT